MYRICQPRHHKSIPESWYTRLVNLKKTRKFQVVLVAGHPTNEELEQGRRERNGLPTSPWNVKCDEECTNLIRDHFWSAS
jgi:hypothetical protein